MNRAEMRRKAREHVRLARIMIMGCVIGRAYWQKMITAAENGSLTGKNGECEEYETD